MQNHTFDSGDEDRIQNTAEGNTPPMQKNTARRDLLSYLHDVVFILAAILVIMLFFCRIIVVSGPSMNQTLMDGDYLLLMNNLFYREPKAGDIVVVSKKTFKEGEPIIKRVIATEGQEVNIDFSSGTVYVDGQALDEPYTNTSTNTFEGVMFPLTVEKDHIFVMGDNRNNSKDSRSPEIGQIDKREVLGKACFLFFPGKDIATEQRLYSRIGVLH